MPIPSNGQEHGRSVRMWSQVQRFAPDAATHFGLPALNCQVKVAGVDQGNGEETERKAQKEGGQHRVLAIRSRGDRNVGLR